MQLITTNRHSIIENNTSDLVKRFIAAQDVKENSKRTYERSLNQFFEWLRGQSIADINKEDLLAFKQALIKKQLSALTVSGYITVVRKFFEWLESEKIYPNIAKGIKGLKHSRGFKKDSLTIEQIKELLNSIDRSTLQGKRDFALLNLLIRTGLRTIEVCRANVEDIRQHTGEAVLWVQGKGRDNKDEFVLLTNDTLKPINDYLNARGSINLKDPLFSSLSDRNLNQALTTRSVSRIVKNNLCGIGLNNDRLTAHSLRHTAITLSLLAGASIQEAQAFGRHANINTTMIYSHNINRVVNAPEIKIDRLLA